MQPCRGITWWGSFEPMWAARGESRLSLALPLLIAQLTADIGRIDPSCLENLLLFRQPQKHPRLLRFQRVGYPILPTHRSILSRRIHPNHEPRRPKPRGNLRNLLENLSRNSKGRIVRRYTTGIKQNRRGLDRMDLTAVGNQSQPCCASALCTRIFLPLQTATHHS